MRQHLFDYIDLATREEYLQHRPEFYKHAAWELTEETRQLLMRAERITFDVETIPEPPAGTYKHLTDGVRKRLGLTYLSEITHLALYSVVEGREVLAVLVAPFTKEEEEFLRELFAREDLLVIGHNLVFDLRITCGHHNVPLPKKTYCTMVGQTTMMGGPKGGYPDGSRRGLDSLMQMYDVVKPIVPYVREAALDWATTYYTVMPTDELEIIIAWQSYMKDLRCALHTLPVAWVTAYVVSDAIGTWHVAEKQMYWSKVLHDAYGYDALWERHEKDQKYQNILNRWTVRGMPLNREWIKEQLEVIQKEKERWLPYFIERGCGTLSTAKEKFRYIFGVCGCPGPDPWQYVAYSNGRGKWYPAEMQGKLWTEAAHKHFNAKGWKEGDYRKWWSTSSDAVEYYIKFGPEEVKPKLKLYNWYTSMVSQEATYREWLDHSEYDGKVHPLLAMTANTGRTIGDTPNPLNVSMNAPREVEVFDYLTGRVTKVTEFTGRGMFAPHAGKVLMEFDASNAEVRMGAVLAGAIDLAQAFADGVDLHKKNAATFNHILVAEVTKEQRGNGKGVFFGMQYGAGAHSIASNPNVLQPVADVAQMVDDWNNHNWEVGVAKKETERQGLAMLDRMSTFPLKAARQAYTVLYNGRWVPAPTVWGQPKLYALWNARQQGGVGGILQDAILEVQEWLDEHPDLGTDMYLMIHDSTIAEVPEDNEEIARLAGQVISRALSTQIPYDITVVNGILVPWPSGCDLYENKDKWGWRPGKEFPYECGTKKEPVEYTCTQAEANEVIFDRARKKIEQEIKDLERQKEYLYQTPPVKKLIWLENGITSCISWETAVQYSIEQHESQARQWDLQLRLLNLPDNFRKGIEKYRDWVRQVYNLEQELKGLYGKRGVYA